ncbi:MAG: hypothetical protein B6247_08595 [Candidatus Parabeggiatoa sp. nov. 2]|nr:MAG: hypothetical protein B6247_08595 [Beggiatoa sp. 4572_84]
MSSNEVERLLEEALLKGQRKRGRHVSNEVERFKKRRTGLIKGQRESFEVLYNKVRRLAEALLLRFQRQSKSSIICVN